jgi:hypothetical protein
METTSTGTNRNLDEKSMLHSGCRLFETTGIPSCARTHKGGSGHVSSNATGALQNPLEWATSQWISFLRKLYPCCDFKEIWPDFEDLITVLDEWELYRAAVQNTQTPRGSTQPSHIKRVFLTHLARLLCEITPAKSESSFSTVRQFVRKCAANRHTVISFDWDVLLEAAAFDENIAACYNEEHSSGLFQAKPHGSINVAHIEPQFATKWGGMSGVTVLQEGTDSLVVCARNPRETKNWIIDPLGVANNNYSDSQTPSGALLVEPTARKSYEIPWLVQQWRRAFQFARAAEEFVIIGFSLPSTDYRPRVLLQLAGIDRSPSPRLLLLDPNACQVAERYRRAVPLPIECYQGSWVEWSAKDN